MALRSWHPKADVSTIVPLVDEPVTSFQHTAVITEQGVAPHLRLGREAATGPRAGRERCPPAGARRAARGGRRPRTRTAPRCPSGREIVMVDKQVVREIVEQAARAPSIHNTQPWRFVAHDDVLELWTDPTRGLAMLDPSGRARHLSCGAALLHARVAAAGAGLAARVTCCQTRTSRSVSPTFTSRRGSRRLRTVSWSARSRPVVDAGAVQRGAAAARRGQCAAACGRARGLLAADRGRSRGRGRRRRAAGPGRRRCRLRILPTATSSAVGRARLTRIPEGVPDSAVPSRPPSSRGSNYRLRDFVADRGERTGIGPVRRSTSGSNVP